MTQAALVVIDMQKDLCYAEKRQSMVTAALAPLATMISEFKARDQPIVYVCFDLPRGDPQFERFGDEYCITGTEGAEIIDELLPLQGPIIRKTKHSAFFETTLDEHLRENGVTDVYLTGLQTQICIMTTAADASFRGYRAVAISDCVVSTHPEVRAEALQWIGRYVGDVRSASEVIQELAHL